MFLAKNALATLPLFLALARLLLSPQAILLPRSGQNLDTHRDVDSRLLKALHLGITVGATGTGPQEVGMFQFKRKLTSWVIILFRKARREDAEILVIP